MVPLSGGRNRSKTFYNRVGGFGIASQRDDEIPLRCSSLLRDGRLLLLNARLAEVIGYREPDALINPLPWLQGGRRLAPARYPGGRFRASARDVRIAGGGIRSVSPCCALQPPESAWP